MLISTLSGVFFFHAIWGRSKSCRLISGANCQPELSAFLSVDQCNPRRQADSLKRLCKGILRIPVSYDDWETSVILKKLASSLSPDRCLDNLLDVVHA